MKRTRKQYTAHDEVAMPRRHRVEHVPVSQLCDEARLQPTVFYRWLKQFFEQGAAAFERSTGPGPERPDLKAQRRIAHLEERLQTKDAVLAELMEEHVALKKNSRGER